MLPAATVQEAEIGEPLLPCPQPSSPPLLTPNSTPSPPRMHACVASADATPEF